MHDNTITSQQQPSLTQETLTRPQDSLAAVPQKTAQPKAKVTPLSLVQRIVQFISKLFGKREMQPAIAAIAAPQPVAFKGSTASTLVAPISVYAGKPVEQAIRRRAEQQFQMMDVTKATRN